MLSVDASRTHQDMVMTAEEATLLVWNCATVEALQRINVSFSDAQSPWPRDGALTASETSVKLTAFAHELYWTAV